jgi:hypothetical protein
MLKIDYIEIAILGLEKEKKKGRDILYNVWTVEFVHSSFTTKLHGKL